MTRAANYFFRSPQHANARQNRFFFFPRAHTHTKWIEFHSRHISLTGDLSSMNVMWTTGELVPGSVVQWGTEPDALRSSAPAANTTYTHWGWRGQFYTATMTGLLPSTRYYYTVGGKDGAKGTLSQVFSFKTLSDTAGEFWVPAGLGVVGALAVWTVYPAVERGVHSGSAWGGCMAVAELVSMVLSSLLSLRADITCRHCVLTLRADVAGTPGSPLRIGWVADMGYAVQSDNTVNALSDLARNGTSRGCLLLSLLAIQ